MKTYSCALLTVFLTLLATEFVQAYPLLNEDLLRALTQEAVDDKRPSSPLVLIPAGYFKDMTRVHKRKPEELYGVLPPWPEFCRMLKMDCNAFGKRSSRLQSLFA